MKRAFIVLLGFLRRLKYRILSSHRNLEGNYTDHQPVLRNGLGSISVGKNVHFGVVNSPFFYNSYTYLEARPANAAIVIGNNVHFNNACSLISERRIVIGDHVLIGFNCQMADSDFHDLDPDKRRQTDPSPREINIGNTVFIGNNVTILKGVSIGDNSVIANGALVTKSFPANVVIGGVPAKLLRNL
ncbi:acyltransferase [Vitellibacter sp. q18]|nr:acyltransferase [Aequorivita lutea]